MIQPQRKPLTTNIYYKCGDRLVYVWKRDLHNYKKSIIIDDLVYFKRGFINYKKEYKSRNDFTDYIMGTVISIKKNYFTVKWDDGTETQTSATFLENNTELLDTKTVS